MKILYVSGSPRKDSNTDFLLKSTISLTIPSLLEADGIVLGSPAFCNNVSAQLKAFIDRAWSTKGSLRNKIGGAVVVGRRDGAESALTVIQAFFLKHEMIPPNRGAHGTAFARGEITEDGVAMESARKLRERLIELEAILVQQ